MGTSVLAQLETGYYTPSYGNDEPDVMRCSADTALKIAGAMDMVVPFKFKAAQMVIDDEVPRNVVWFENTKKKGSARHNFRIEVDFGD